MSNQYVNVPKPVNDAIRMYAPGSPERAALKKELEKQSNEVLEIPLVIDGKEVLTQNKGKLVMPHDHSHVLANYSIAGEEEIKAAIKSNLNAKEKWYAMPWEHRASIFLKAADLISGPRRNKIIAATMLGQSKSVFQTELDAACMMVDSLRYFVHIAQEIYRQQPNNAPTMWNRIEYRPLDGFIAAVCPFNFTAIAANLIMAPAVMGNAVIWKPAPTAILSNYFIYQALLEAGLPKGVVNFLPAGGLETSEYMLKDENLAGFHFTGSTKTFKSVWSLVGDNIDNYYNFPRLVGETGGKGFVFAHSSANVNQLVVSTIRGAFEYQGQKCSAASRMFVPSSIWEATKEQLVRETKNLKMGDVRDFETFLNAVIDEVAYKKIIGYIEYIKSSDNAEILCGGGYDDSKGWFIEPTIVVTKDRNYKTLKEEIFGPVLTIYVYEDDKFEEELQNMRRDAPYALTGAIFADDREAIATMELILKEEAGNLYINDKPTGAMIGHQPFGGARGSGTNDKAGSAFNLMRWTSPRTIKEVFLPPEVVPYPYMAKE